MTGGLVLLAYGGTNLRLNVIASDNAAKASLCRAWLCPSEFTPSVIYDLHRRSIGPDRSAALDEFKRALAEDPASAVRWAELAEALAGSKDASLAEYCMKQAVNAGTHSAAILARAGNFFFLRGDNSQSRFYFRQILGNPEFEDYYPAIFLTYSRMQVPVADLLANSIPALAEASRAFLEFQMQAGHTAEAQIVWSWMVKHHFDNVPVRNEYLQFLVGLGQPRAAADLWANTKRSADPGYRVANWVFNGDLETASDSSLFDWKIDIQPDVLVQLAEANRSGMSSFQVQFTGEANPDFRGLHQNVVLAPGKWRLSAQVRTEGITTDQGVGVRIWDVRQSRLLDVRTEALTGSNGWTTLQKIFEVGQSTAMAQVEVFREASTRLDNKITGTAWISAVKLAPLR